MFRCHKIAITLLFFSIVGLMISFVLQAYYPNSGAFWTVLVISFIMVVLATVYYIKIFNSTKVNMCEKTLDNESCVLDNTIKRETHNEIDETICSNQNFYPDELMKNIDPFNNETAIKISKNIDPFNYNIGEKICNKVDPCDKNVNKSHISVYKL